MHKNKEVIKGLLAICVATATVVIAVVCVCFKGNSYAYPVDIKDVTFEDDDFRKSCFSVGSDYIYMCAFSKDESDYYIAKAPINSNVLEKLHYEIPENMKVLRISADSSGECSLLLSTFHEEDFEGEKATFIDFNTTRIDRIGTDGQLKYSLDISDEFKKAEEIPLIFEADEGDNFYVNDGSVLMHFSIKDKIEKFIIDGYYETVMCENGKAYTVYYDYSAEKTFLSLIEDGGISKVAELETFNEDYRSISKSGDDLYLYSREGLFKYSNDTQECLYKDDNITDTRRFMDGEDLSAEGELCILLNVDEKYSVRHVRYKDL